MSTLSRRSLVSSAAALPALAVPAASAAPAPACTLPPELIERFVRVRAWFLKDNARYQVWSDKIGRRFYAATGLPIDEYRDLDYDDPRRKELRPAFDKVFAEAPEYRSEAEADELHEERWAVAEALMECRPQTFADLAYQAEAFLIADLEILTDPLTHPGLFHSRRSLAPRIAADVGYRLRAVAMPPV